MPKVDLKKRIYIIKYAPKIYGEVYARGGRGNAKLITFDKPLWKERKYFNKDKAIRFAETLQIERRYDILYEEILEEDIMGYVGEHVYCANCDNFTFLSESLPTCYYCGTGRVS